MYPSLMAGTREESRFPLRYLAGVEKRLSRHTRVPVSWSFSQRESALVGVVVLSVPIGIFRLLASPAPGPGWMRQKENPGIQLCVVHSLSLEVPRCCLPSRCQKCVLIFHIDLFFVECLGFFIVFSGRNRKKYVSLIF